MNPFQKFIRKFSEELHIQDDDDESSRRNNNNFNDEILAKYESAHVDDHNEALEDTEAVKKRTSQGNSKEQRDIGNILMFWKNKTTPNEDNEDLNEEDEDINDDASNESDYSCDIVRLRGGGGGSNIGITHGQEEGLLLEDDGDDVEEEEDDVEREDDDTAEKQRLFRRTSDGKVTPLLQEIDDDGSTIIEDDVLVTADDADVPREGGQEEKDKSSCNERTKSSSSDNGIFSKLFKFQPLPPKRRKGSETKDDSKDPTNEENYDEAFIEEEHFLGGIFSWFKKSKKVAKVSMAPVGSATLDHVSASTPPLTAASPRKPSLLKPSDKMLSHVRIDNGGRRPRGEGGGMFLLKSIALVAMLVTIGAMLIVTIVIL